MAKPSTLLRATLLWHTMLRMLHGTQVAWFDCRFCTFQQAFLQVPAPVTRKNKPLILCKTKQTSLLPAGIEAKTTNIYSGTHTSHVSTCLKGLTVCSFWGDPTIPLQDEQRTSKPFFGRSATSISKSWMAWQPHTKILLNSGVQTASKHLVVNLNHGDCHFIPSGIVTARWAKCHAVEHCATSTNKEGKKFNSL